MGGYRRVGTSLLALGALLLAVVTVAPAQITVWASNQITAKPQTGQSKVVLGDTSIDGPALWSDNLGPGSPNPGVASVLAWTGTDPGHSLNVMQSSDGLTYGGKVTFPARSASRPAVAVQGPPATIVLAWTGTDANHSLNLLCQGVACGTGPGSEKTLVLTGQSSFTSPALVRFGSGFLLAWAGTNAQHSLNILRFSLSTSGSGFQLGAQTVLSQLSSISAPSLALNPQNNQLLLSWSAANPANQLAFATSGDGVNWSHAQMLPEMSSAAPTGFAVAAPSMPTYWMTWTGTDLAHSVNVRHTETFPWWPLSNNKLTLSDTALGGPALGYVGNVGQMLVAWTGTDAAHHLNVATIGTTTTPLDQRIDAYIATLSTAQQIGQTLMISVCANSYNANLDQALKQWDVGSAIIYTSCNGGPTEPPTAAGLQQLDQALQSNASPVGSLLIGIDEEGGTVDRLAPYYGGTPSAQQLAATGNPQNAYAQAQTDAARMRSLGLNLDFAPMADVYQGGGEGPSRMFGTTDGMVITYAGAFLDGLQQNGVAGTLKHWPGLGAATGNPDYVLPTINQSQAQMQAIDFPPFSALLSHQPGMIMVTTVMAPAFDAQNPAMLSPALVTQVLRGQLGYQGGVVTDALGAQGLILYMQQQGYNSPVQGIAEASVRAFLAGDDLLLCPLDQPTLSAIVGAMTQSVQSGRISQTQLHASVHRILRLKVALGLLSLP